MQSIDIIDKGIEEKLHLGAQIYVWKDNSVIINEAVGSIRENTPLLKDHIMPWMSCSKMIVATGLAILWERGQLDYNWPVANIIPEFGCKGKEAITFTHLLTHTGGFRVLTGPWEKMTKDELIAGICNLPLEKDWVPGKTAGYHVHTSWMILGEVILRITGKAPEDFIRDEIFLPLEMKTSFLAVPNDFYSANESIIAPFFNTSVESCREQRDKFHNSACPCKPGGSGRGPVSELANFLHMLNNGGSFGSARILQQTTVDMITRPFRKGMHDKSFMHIIDWGLGFMVDSKKYNQPTQPYSFGPGCSENTFGHNGNQSSAGYVDKTNNVIIAFAFNGMPGEPKHQVRINELNEAIYKDLGLL